MIKRGILLLLLAGLVACGQSLEGNYSDAMGMMNYRFSSDGKVSMGALGLEVQYEYEIDGNEIRVLMPEGASQVLTLLEDGTIKGPMGMILSPKEGK